MYSSWLGNRNSTFNQSSSSSSIRIWSKNLSIYLSKLKQYLWILTATVFDRLTKVYLKVGTNNTSKENGRASASIIPVYSSLPLGLQLPPMIETIILAPRVRREGIKFVERIYQEYKDEPMFKVPLLNDHIIVIRCPMLIQKLLGSNNLHVLNKPQYMYKYIFPGYLGQGLVSADIQSWSPHRKILNKCFSFRAIQSYFGIMNRNGSHLISDLLDRCTSSNNGVVQTKQLNEAIYFHVLGIISEMLMGEKIFNEEETENFYSRCMTGKSLVTYKAQNPQNILPIFWWLNPKRKALDDLLLELKNIVGVAVQRSKEKVLQMNPNQTESEHIPIRSIIEEMIYNGMPESEMISEVSIFLLAGHETTVTAIKYFLQHIAEHPDIQKLCQAEVDSIFEAKSYGEENDNSAEDLTMNDLANLKYLERCILETLRITAVSPFITRELSAPIQLSGYQTFKKNTIVCFPIWAIQRDPKLFPNPGQFDPDRFLPENMKQRSSYSFLAFSHGPRNCIGYKVAMMEMKIILGGILRHFNVETNDKLEDIPIHFDITTFPERDYNATLTKRRR